MKQSNTDFTAQQKRKKDALQSAVLSSVLMLLSGGVLLILCAVYDVEGIWRALLTIAALLDLTAIIPVWILLKKRWKEIEGGEEDAAAKY